MGHGEVDRCVPEVQIPPIEDCRERASLGDEELADVQVAMSDHEVGRRGRRWRGFQDSEYGRSVDVDSRSVQRSQPVRSRRPSSSAIQSGQAVDLNCARRQILRKLADKGYAGPLSVELFLPKFQQGDPFEIAKEIRQKAESVMRQARVM